MKTISTNLAVYGLAHGLVDAMCAGVLFSTVYRQIFSDSEMTYLILVYNLLAFGLQVFVGFAVDYFKVPRLSAIAGIILTGFSTLIFMSSPILAIVLAGTGNAMFHIGGGVASLSLTPRKATAPGIFVAPGALGLMVGTVLGRGGHFVAWPFLLAAAVLAVLVFVIPKPIMYPEQPKPAPVRGFRVEYIIYLVLFVITVRSLIGFAVVYPWKSDIDLLVILTISVVLGKGLGGFLADRFGWTLTAVGSLVLSIPFLIAGVNIPVLGMMGMFLFNITMPVTLTVVANMVPGKPGTAFGLTCAALVLGTLPAFSTLQPGLSSPVFIIIVILISALALYSGLRYYHNAQQKKDIQKSVLSPAEIGENK
jgi:FSR family fosmidomycin resistance protein-like MFS transporter